MGVKGEKHRTHWVRTGKQDRLKKAREQGVETVFLMERFGMSRNAIIGKLWRMRTGRGK